MQTLGTTAQWWQTTDTLLTTGSFVVGLRGRINADQTAGGITYLTMTPAQFKTFTEDLFDDSLNNYVPSGTVLDIGNALALMILNPTQYIASCLWIPGTPSQTQAATGFNVGWWGFTSGAGILTPASTLSYNTTITLTDHPQAATRGRFLNCQPFTSRLLHLPRYGVVDVSNHIPANALQLYITLNVDPLSGQGLYKIYYRTQLGQYPDLNLIDEIQCQIGVEMPLSSNQITIQDVISSVTSLASAAYDAASFNGIGAAADIASSLQILQPHINDISSASGFLGYPGDIGAPYMFSYFRLVAAEDNTEEGRPYCQISTPATLTGYMQVLHGDIMSSNATARELEEIRADLEGGFYYE